jgi:hypothetical protein
MRQIERRVIRDDNGFYREQMRFLPAREGEPNDGWRTTKISSIQPAKKTSK